ncbi:MAG TPA: FGGY family carbohydrate kinase, partial [Pseudobdellovibrionaceae bacterium]|nr:FGGY family carbohydrate kinase [Pseudobdellovibrionaceae bacterium]
MSKYIFAIDQGTTSTRSCLVALDGSLVAMSQKPFPQIFPQPGWVEHDPEVIWKSFLETQATLFKENKVNPDDILGVGITNQRETVVAWDALTGRSLYNAIVWQCRRTQSSCEKLKRQNKEKMIQKKTGLLIDPYFSATKMNWLLKNVPAVQKARKQGNLKFGTMDSFLVWRLSKGKNHITDVTNASRTMLMNLKTMDWDDELLTLFGIKRSELPQIVSSSGRLGEV